MNTKLLYRMSVEAAQSPQILSNGKPGGRYVTSYHEFATHEEAQGFKSAMAITLNLKKFEWEPEPYSAIRRNAQSHGTDVLDAVELLKAERIAYDHGFFGEDEQYQLVEDFMDFEEYQYQYRQGVQDEKEERMQHEGEAREAYLYDPQW